MPQSTLFKEKYRINSTRLKEWDYAADGYYFVTICTKDRTPWFGEVVNGRMVVSEVGDGIDFLLQQIGSVDTYVVMPDHLHIIVIVENDTEPCRDAINRVSTGQGGITGKKNPMVQTVSLGKIIRSFKAQSAWHIHKFCPDFSWQSGFFDRVIRNEDELHRIRQYIAENPVRWKEEVEKEDRIFFEEDVWK